MPPAARITDMHTCPMVTPGLPPIPHVGGPILPAGCPTVLIGMLPAARVSDMAVCVGPPDIIVKGSMTVLIGNMPAARMGDQTAHGGVIVIGEPTVMIGDSGSGGGGGGGAAGSGPSGSGPRAVAGPGPGPGMSEDLAQAFALAASLVAAFTASANSGAAIASSESSGAGIISGFLAGVADLVHRFFGERYSDGIVIKGPKEYREKVRARLDALKSTASGQQIVNDLDRQGRAGKGVTIVPAEPGDNHCMPTGNWKDAFPEEAAEDATNGRIAVAKPGRGTSSDVGFNPDYEPTYPDGTSCRSPEVGLGHELLHATHNGDGTNLARFEDATDPGTLDPSNHEEAQTIGRGAYAADWPTDNSLRAERGFKPRDSHGSVCP